MKLSEIKQLELQFGKDHNPDRDPPSTGGGNQHDYSDDKISTLKQKNFDFDGLNLQQKADKLHHHLAADPKFQFKQFIRKPESWDEVITYTKRHVTNPITMKDLASVMSYQDLEELEFIESQVWGYSANRPLKDFSPKFKAKKLMAFLVVTADGVFVVRTEGSNYVRYAAQVKEESDNEN